MRRFVGVCLILAALAALGQVALAGSASTRPTYVEMLANETAEQTATSPGAIDDLTSVGGISTRAVCTMTEHGYAAVEVQIKSEHGGGFLFGLGDVRRLTSSFSTTFRRVGGGNVFEFTVRTAPGAFQRYAVTWASRKWGVDCTTHIAVTNG